MDRGWATGRGRALWTTVGVVVAIALIGGSLIALNRSLLSFDGWLSGSQPGAAQQTLPPEPDTVIGTRSIGGRTRAAPGIPSPAGGAVVAAPPHARGRGGAAGGGTAGGAPRGARGGRGGRGAPAGGGEGGAGGAGGDGGYGGAGGGGGAGGEPADGRGAQHRDAAAGSAAAGRHRQRRRPGCHGACRGDEPDDRRHR